MLDPLSPRKTLLFLPKYPKLYARKPNIAPMGINKPYEKFPRNATKIIGINANDAHIPLRPSIILKAFIIPTTQKIVKGAIAIAEGRQEKLPLCNLDAQR